MKKALCMLFILLMLLYPCFAMHTSIKIGMQESRISYYQQGEYYIDITLTQLIGELSLYGNYRNEMNFAQWKPFRFAPVQDYYTVGASYDFEFATIRLEHMCMHPVVSQSKWNGLQGGYTKFEITIGD